jgi:hypothetical protein
MDVSGNDARLTGGANIQDCGELPIGAGIDIDVVLPPPGIDAADGMKGYEFKLIYDPGVVNVGAEAKMLVSQAPGSIPLSLSDFPPDSDGSFTSAAIDIGAPGDPEPAGVSEIGPGVLARITLTAVAPGTSSLTLTDIIPVDAVGDPIPVGSVLNATVVVGGTCAPGVAVDGDGDGDGFTDGEELSAGTDPADDCPDDLGDDAWPADLSAAGGYGKHDGEINVLDIVQLTEPYFNASAPDPNYSVRRDLNGDGMINILDIVRVTPPTFGKICAP